MFKINRKIEYALIALKYMSQKSPGQLTTAKEICALFNAPFDPMARVLQIMGQAGILRAEQGVNGGYQITKDLSKITLGDLNELIVGPVQIANCFHSKATPCDLTSFCTVIGPMLTLNERISELFHTLTVNDLIHAHHSREKTIRKQSFLASKPEGSRKKASAITA